MKTRMTETFGIKHPIMLAGMAYVSMPKLVAAVSNAGGLGMFNSVATPPSELNDAIKEIRSLTDKPFGVNVTLLFPNARENAEIALGNKVPIINFALGKGDWIAKAAHTYGGKVISTVATERHAQKAEQDGADAIIVTGFEAAAHGGETATMVLLPLIASKVKIPIIAAGGFADGKGLVAALALGADGISMGTRFLVTQEAPVHPKFKDVFIKANSEETLRSDKIDGLPGRFWINKATMEMAKGKIPLGKAMANASKVSKAMKVPFYKLAISGLSQRGALDLVRQAVTLGGLNLTDDPGDVQTIYLAMGQVTGRITDIPSAKDVIEKTVAEAEDIIKGLNKKVG